MFDRYTDRARRAIVCAQEEAERRNDPTVGTEHLLLGLLHEPQGLAAVALDSFGVTLEGARAAVVAAADDEPHGPTPFHDDAKEALANAATESVALHHNYIGTEHLLLGLLAVDDCAAVHLLGDLGADPVAVRERVLAVVADATKRR